ncbi:MAG: hypothetical protein ACE5JG_10000, partial [Planctomycetota bacterium]
SDAERAALRGAELRIARHLVDAAEPGGEAVADALRLIASAAAHAGTVADLHRRSVEVLEADLVELCDRALRAADETKTPAGRVRALAARAYELGEGADPKEALRRLRAAADAARKDGLSEKEEVNLLQEVVRRSEEGLGGGARPEDHRRLAGYARRLGDLAAKEDPKAAAPWFVKAGEHFVLARDPKQAKAMLAEVERHDPTAAGAAALRGKIEALKPG